MKNNERQLRVQLNPGADAELQRLKKHGDTATVIINKLLLESAIRAEEKDNGYETR